MYADLHIHTTASDGCWAPEELITQVRAAGIGFFAIADHDSLTNVIRTAQLARQARLAFLPAAEVSALMNGIAMHILAYGVNPTDPGLNRMLEQNRALLEWADEEMLRRLAKAGYPLSLEAYARYEHEPSRGGWKALNFLIDNGICRDVHDFMARFFVEGIRPPWPDFPHPAEVCQTISAAGGLPVLAHPGSSLDAQRLNEKGLVPFLEFGIAGLECYTPHHDDAATGACLAFCARHDLLITGGSDCHGGFAGRRLGVPPVRVEDLRLGPLEEALAPEWRDRQPMESKR